MVLIVTPFLVTAIIIACFVTFKLLTQIPSFIGSVEETFINLQKEYLSVAVNLRATFVEFATNHGLKELQILTRVSGWLLFGGIERSRSFTEMTSFIEECKVFDKKTCPHFRDKIKAPCDCEWNDTRAYDQIFYSYNNNSRYLQKQTYSVETQKTWSNGDRNSTGFPDVSFSPNTTAWLNNVEDAPGFQKGSLAEGYESTYDRLRVIPALSVIQMPLYNHDRSKSKSRGHYVSFEADGTHIAYTGCSRGTDDNSHWKSTEKNEASSLRPELCPLGKHGYDPRCRGWYDSAKKIYEKGSMNVSPLYVSEPYGFAITNRIGQSSALPLFDPTTNQYVGQTLVDSIPEIAFNALDTNGTELFDMGSSFVITADGEYIIIPNSMIVTKYTETEFKNLGLPHDGTAGDTDCTSAHRFKSILCDMKRGEHNVTQFTRVKNDTSEETVYISYAPVKVRNFFSQNSSDFSRGVEQYESMIYFIAFMVPQATRFKDTVESLTMIVGLVGGIIFILIFLVTAIVAFFLSHITASITKPIIHISKEMKKFNW
eukprot:15345414-Ditylum_brightwellii.AAC.1